MIKMSEEASSRSCWMVLQRMVDAGSGCLELQDSVSKAQVAELEAC